MVVVSMGVGGSRASGGCLPGGWEKLPDSELSSESFHRPELPSDGASALGRDEVLVAAGERLERNRPLGREQGGCDGDAAQASVLVGTCLWELHVRISSGSSPAAPRMRLCAA